MESPRRFVFLALAWALLLAAVVAGFNVLVDPYLLFDTPRWPGFNAVKPGVEKHELMMKAYQSRRVVPGALIVGSSRVDIGMASASAAWPDSLRPVYNLGLVGTSVHTGLEYVRHVLAGQAEGAAPPVLVVGLDFENFLARPGPEAAAPPPAAQEEQPLGEVEQRLAVLEDGRPNPARRLRVIQDHALAALSIDALSDSLKSIAASRSPAGWPDLGDDGHSAETQLRGWVDFDGVDALFAQKNQQIIRQYRAPRWQLSRGPDEPSPELKTVSDVIDFARPRRMRVLLAIQPSHASRLELMDRMGYWPDYERWKRQLVQLVDAERARGVAVELFDFGGYEAYMQESIPAPGDRKTRMRWFWDPVHYTTALGDLMLREMLADPATLPSDRPTAGARLAGATLEARLAAVRRDREAYRQRQAGDVARVQRMYCQAAGC